MLLLVGVAGRQMLPRQDEAGAPRADMAQTPGGGACGIATTSEQELGLVSGACDSARARPWDPPLPQRRCRGLPCGRDVHSDAGECHDAANGWRGRKSRGDANAPVLISHPDVLEFIARRAEAAGLGDQIGLLIPGHTPTSSPSARRTSIIYLRTAGPATLFLFAFSPVMAPGSV